MALFVCLLRYSPVRDRFDIAIVALFLIDRGVACRLKGGGDGAPRLNTDVSAPKAAGFFAGNSRRGRLFLE